MQDWASRERSTLTIANPDRNCQSFFDIPGLNFVPLGGEKWQTTLDAGGRTGYQPAASTQIPRRQHGSPCAKPLSGLRSTTMHQQILLWLARALHGKSLLLALAGTALLSGGCSWLDPWDDPPPQPRTVSEWMQQPRVGDKHYGE